LYHILSHRGASHKAVITGDEVDAWVKSDVRWLVSRYESRSQRIREVGPIIDGKLQWCAIPHEFYFKVSKGMKVKSPNTGVTAIAHLLSSRLANLNVIGFDFYRSGVYDGYGDVKESEEALEVNKRWHDTNAQLDYLAVLKRRDNRLVFDDVLQGIIDGYTHSRSGKAR
jgi:hypothetical protein